MLILKIRNYEILKILRFSKILILRFSIISKIPENIFRTFDFLDRKKKLGRKNIFSIFFHKICSTLTKYECTTPKTPKVRLVSRFWHFLVEKVSFFHMAMLAVPLCDFGPILKIFGDFEATLGGPIKKLTLPSTEIF